ncbi:MAG: phosphatidylserine decarboxylase [Thiotrichales bacterium]|nr:MAG: phosphatidylserine decarboxylase [Thiotrichales bacterium]
MKASLTERLRALPFYILPHHGISWVIFKLARIRWKPFKNFAIAVYTRLHSVNLQEAVIADKYGYESLNAFFTRALKPDARPLAVDEDDWICPVDGTVSQAGRIDHGRIFQAKGHDYSLLELLGGDDAMADPFKDGRFATLYLSPRDYHRIHMPTAADLVSMTYVPGRLFSVAEFTVRAIPRLFARNERVVCRFETARGPMVMVLVGAINVSATETAWHGLVTTNGGRIKKYGYKDSEVSLKRGEEMGRFNLGSTVILITTEQFELEPVIQAGAAVQMGMSIGRATIESARDLD